MTRATTAVGRVPTSLLPRGFSRVRSLRDEVREVAGDPPHVRWEEVERGGDPPAVRGHRDAGDRLDAAFLVLEEELGADGLAVLDVPEPDGRDGGTPLVVVSAALLAELH